MIQTDIYIECNECNNTTIDSTFYGPIEWDNEVSSMTNEKKWIYNGHYICPSCQKPKGSPHFKPHEYACKCGKCDGGELTTNQLEHMEALRVRLSEVAGRDTPVIITPNGGVRCPAWNDERGGAKESRHLRRVTEYSREVDQDGNQMIYETINIEGKSDACDIIVPGFPTWVVGDHAVKCGFTGIGIGSSITHVDTRPKFNARGFSLWTYNSNYRAGRFWASLRGME